MHFSWKIKTMNEMAEFEGRHGGFQLFGNNVNNGGLMEIEKLQQGQDNDSEDEYEAFQFKKSNSNGSYTYGIEEDNLFPTFSVNQQMNHANRNQMMSRGSSKNASDRYFSEFESSLEEEMTQKTQESRFQPSLRTEANVFQPRIAPIPMLPQHGMALKEMQQQQYRENLQHLLAKERAPTFTQHTQQQPRQMASHQQPFPPQSGGFVTQYQMQQQQQQMHTVPRPLLPHQQPRIQPKSQQRAMQVNGVPVRRSNGRPSVNERSIVYQVISALCLIFVNLS